MKPTARFHPRRRARPLPGFCLATRTGIAGFLTLCLVSLPACALAADPPGTAANEEDALTIHPDSVEIVPVPRPRPPTLKVQVWTDQSRYGIGDEVMIYFRSDRDARVYIFNTDAGGATRQIFPNAFDRDNWVHGDVTYAIPDATYRLVATGPVGWETLRIVAHATSHIYFPSYHRFLHPEADPFPLRPGGPQPLLQRLESGEGSWVPAEPEPGPGVTEYEGQTGVPSPHEEVSPSDRESAMVPVPPPRPPQEFRRPGRFPPPDYGEDQTTFYVGPQLGGYYYYYEEPHYPPYYPPYRPRPHPYRRYPRFDDYRYRFHDRNDFRDPGSRWEPEEPGHDPDWTPRPERTEPPEPTPQIEPPGRPRGHILPPRPELNEKPRPLVQPRPTMRIQSPPRVQAPQESQPSSQAERPKRAERPEERTVPQQPQQPDSSKSTEKSDSKSSDARKKR